MIHSLQKRFPAIYQNSQNSEQAPTPRGEQPPPDVSNISFFPIAAVQESTATGESGDLALLLVDPGRNIVSLSQSAADVLNTTAPHSKGQPLESIAGGVLSALALRTEATMAMTMFDLEDGRTIIATTRTLTGRNGKALGWVVTLYENLAAALGEFRTRHHASSPAIATLQSQIQNMQELLAMLPRFRQHRYWNYLLMEHIERLTDQMAEQVQLLVPPAA